MAEKTFRNDLTEGSVAGKLLRFSLPLFASNAFQAIYNIVDMIVVGQVMGKEGMAGVSIGGDILMFLTAISFGFSGAGQIIIAQNVGAKRYDDVKKIIGTLFSFLFIVSLSLTVICLVLRYKMLEWISTPADAFVESYNYTLTCAFGLFFIYGYNVVSAILRGMGDSKRPFTFVAIAAVINAGLDVLFVVVFKWHAFGAALATVIGQGTSFVFSLVYLYKHKEAFGFDFKLSSFRMSGEHLKTILSLGIPMAIQTAAISFSRLIVGRWINGFGSVAAAVTGIYHKSCRIVTLFATAFNTSGGSMVGQCIGAEKYDRVKKVVYTVFAMMLSVSVVIIAAFYFFPAQIFRIFTSDEEVIIAALPLVWPMIFYTLGSAGRAPSFALINGSGFAALNFTIAILDGLVCRLSLSYLFAFVLEKGAYGCWLGDGLSGFVPFLVGFVYFLSGTWRTNKFLLKRQMGKQNKG